jgi:hypothetical protein
MCYTHRCIISEKQHKIVITLFLMGIFPVFKLYAAMQNQSLTHAKQCKNVHRKDRPTSPQIADGKCRAIPRKNTVNWEPFPVDFA